MKGVQGDSAYCRVSLFGVMSKGRTCGDYSLGALRHGASDAGQLSPDSRLLFMSAYMDVDYLKSAIKLAAVDFIEKPIKLAEVEQAFAKTMLFSVNVFPFIT